MRIAAYESLRNAGRVFLIALALLFPITGLVLDGYDYHLLWQRPFYLAGGIAALVAITGVGRTMLQGVIKQPATFNILTHNSHLSRLLATAFLLMAVTMPWMLSKYWLSVAIMALIYVLLGLGLNIVVGLAGLLDLGFVAFYAVGAYTYALGSQYFDLGFWAALPCAAITAATMGALLGFPVLRTHGDYLAIVTLGFGEIIRLILNNWLAVTGGPNGLSAPPPTFFGLEFARRASEGRAAFHEFFGLDYSNLHRYLFIYFVLLIFVLFVYAFVNRLRCLPIGRNWEALREDEIACRSLGINHVTTKLSAFATGAMIGSLGGVFFAAFQGFVNPTSFTFIESVLILAIVVLGGLGSTIGVVIAAVVLTLLFEVLRDFSDFRFMVYGLLLMGMMIWRPQGLVRFKRRHYADPRGDAS